MFIIFRPTVVRTPQIDQERTTYFVVGFGPSAFCGGVALKISYPTRFTRPPSTATKEKKGYGTQFMLVFNRERYGEILAKMAKLGTVGEGVAVNLVIAQL